MALDAILTEALVIGLAAGFVAAAIRTLVPTSWTARKPFGCALCMGWWCAAILWTAWNGNSYHGSIWALLGSAAVAAVVNGWIIPPRIEGNLLG
jgi:hypothetical protein